MGNTLSCLQWTVRDLKNDISSQAAPARRAVLRGLALSGLSVAVAACGSTAGQSATAAGTTAPTSTLPELPKTPDGALQRLMAGNERLLTNKALHTQTLEGIRQHATGQSPYAQVFGCADSRVPVEAVFDEDFGDVFVTRTAGNVLSDPTVGTIEYGVVALNTPLIMVLGHQNCGAVKAAVDAMKDPGKTPPGALGALVSALVPAAREVKDRGDDIYAAALEAHIRKTVATLEANPVVKESVAAGKLRVVGAAYDLATAKVTLYQ
ncbi:carbonic anhydrase [Saccharothrix deserti]|uniref:carbonic anhydrase n=1 Tax=Saccharothrix deserti TaxID=2593674 RepID=UPI00131CDFEA|nr:carbonic anhydrase [Saccharothrix deserti]